MNVITIPNGTMQANCYIVETDNTAVIIDPGYVEKTLLKYVVENLEKIKYILLSHRHFDHLSGADKLRQMTGAKIVIHELDECGLYSDVLNLSKMAGGFYEKANPDCYADVFVDDGDTVTADDLSFQVIYTPGHTEGGVSYLCENLLFSGDTLFKGSIGRTDFPSSSISEMRISLDRICMLPDSTVVYPGHGEPTTIGTEKKTNNYLSR